MATGDSGIPSKKPLSQIPRGVGLLTSRGARTFGSGSTMGRGTTQARGAVPLKGAVSNSIRPSGSSLETPSATAQAEVTTIVNLPSVVPSAHLSESTISTPIFLPASCNSVSSLIPPIHFDGLPPPNILPPTNFLPQANQLPCSVFVTCPPPPVNLPPPNIASPPCCVHLSSPSVTAPQPSNIASPSCSVPPHPPLLTAPLSCTVPAPIEPSAPYSEPPHVVTQSVPIVVPPLVLPSSPVLCHSPPKLLPLSTSLLELQEIMDVMSEDMPDEIKEDDVVDLLEVLTDNGGMLDMVHPRELSLVVRFVQGLLCTVHDRLVRARLLQVIELIVRGYQNDMLTNSYYCDKRRRLLSARNRALLEPMPIIESDEEPWISAYKTNTIVTAKKLSECCSGEPDLNACIHDKTMHARTLPDRTMPLNSVPHNILPANSKAAKIRPANTAAPVYSPDVLKQIGHEYLARLASENTVEIDLSGQGWAVEADARMGRVRGSDTNRRQWKLADSGEVDKEAVGRGKESPLLGSGESGRGVNESAVEEGQIVVARGKVRPKREVMQIYVAPGQRQPVGPPSGSLSGTKFPRRGRSTLVASPHKDHNTITNTVDNTVSDTIHHTASDTFGSIVSNTIDSTIDKSMISLARDVNRTVDDARVTSQENPAKTRILIGNKEIDTVDWDEEDLDVIAQLVRQHFAKKGKILKVCATGTSSPTDNCDASTISSASTAEASRADMYGMRTISAGATVPGSTADTSHVSTSSFVSTAASTSDDDARAGNGTMPAENYLKRKSLVDDTDLAAAADTTSVALESVYQSLTTEELTACNEASAASGVMFQINDVMCEAFSVDTSSLNPAAEEFEPIDIVAATWSSVLQSASSVAQEIASSDIGATESSGVPSLWPDITAEFVWSGIEASTSSTSQSNVVLSLLSTIAQEFSPTDIATAVNTLTSVAQCSLPAIAQDFAPTSMAVAGVNNCIPSTVTSSSQPTSSSDVKMLSSAVNNFPVYTMNASGEEMVATSTHEWRESDIGKPMDLSRYLVNSPFLYSSPWCPPPQLTSCIEVDSDIEVARGTCCALEIKEWSEFGRSCANNATPSQELNAFRSDSEAAHNTKAAHNSEATYNTEAARCSARVSPSNKTIEFIPDDSVSAHGVISASAIKGQSDVKHNAAAAHIAPNNDLSMFIPDTSAEREMTDITRCREEIQSIIDNWLGKSEPVSTSIDTHIKGPSDVIDYSISNISNVACSNESQAVISTHAALYQPMTADACVQDSQPLKTCSDILSHGIVEVHPSDKLCTAADHVTVAEAKPHPVKCGPDMVEKLCTALESLTVTEAVDSPSVSDSFSCSSAAGEKFGKLIAAEPIVAERSTTEPTTAATIVGETIATEIISVETIKAEPISTAVFYSRLAVNAQGKNTEIENMKETRQVTCPASKVHILSDTSNTWRSSAIDDEASEKLCSLATDELVEEQASAICPAEEIGTNPRIDVSMTCNEDTAAGLITTSALLDENENRQLYIGALKIDTSLPDISASQTGFASMISSEFVRMDKLGQYHDDEELLEEVHEMFEEEACDIRGDFSKAKALEDILVTRPEDISVMRQELFATAIFGTMERAGTAGNKELPERFGLPENVEVAEAAEALNSPVTLKNVGASGGFKSSEKVEISGVFGILQRCGTLDDFESSERVVEKAPFVASECAEVSHSPAVEGFKRFQSEQMFISGVTTDVGGLESSLGYGSEGGSMEVVGGEIGMGGVREEGAMEGVRGDGERDMRREVSLGECGEEEDGGLHSTPKDKNKKKDQCLVS